MLPEMARQILNGFAKLKIFTNARMAKVETRVTKAVIEGVILIAIFPVCDRGRKFVQSFGIELEDFTDLARCHATAVGNDIRSHGGATPAITAVQILNYFFAIVAAGKIEINVGPLTTLFGKESLEEQLHANRIYGSNAE